MRITETMPIADLIDRCAAGDDIACAQFYAEYARLVRTAVVRTSRTVGESAPGGVDADDLTNEIFAKLLDNDGVLLRRVRNARSLNAWLVAIARNHTIDHLRRMAIFRRTAEHLGRAEPRPAPSPEPDAIRAEQVRLVKDVVGRLESSDRLVLELYYLQGLTYAEIAAILHSNVNTISTRVRRARAKLKQLLAKRGVYEP